MTMGEDLRAAAEERKGLIAGAGENPPYTRGLQRQLGEARDRYVRAEAENERLLYDLQVFCDAERRQREHARALSVQGHGPKVCPTPEGDIPWWLAKEALRVMYRFVSSEAPELDQLVEEVAKKGGLDAKTLDATVPLWRWILIHFRDADAYAVSLDRIREVLGLTATHYIVLPDDVKAVVKERDDLREALKNLAEAEAAYRLAHDVEGDKSMKAGRAWDVMRRAGDKARAMVKPKEAKTDG